MVKLLLLLGLLQAQAPEIRLTLDRDRVAVGDEVTASITATSHSLAPMQVDVPSLVGFELLGRSERTEVTQFGGPTRTTTLELRVRALKAGQWTIGPVRASQGNATVTAAAATVRVDPPRAARAMATNPMLRRLLERAPPPSRAGDPAVTLVVSSRTTSVGEQVDVLTAAWFPRELRAQLRRPPTLQPPVIEGVWSYPQPVPPGIAATRAVNGTLYDLFVAHQVIFPLVPGRITVTPAVLKYSVPLAMQFFSQEQRYTLQSLPETLSVAETPVAGRPAGYSGAVGQGLRIERSIEPATVRAGEPVTVSITLRGDGNPALWPVPPLTWPPGARTYPDRTDEQVNDDAGRLGGSKTFRFTLVADSAGTMVLPGTAYNYFDTGTRTYRTASLGASPLPVAPSSETRIARPLPPPLLIADGPPLAWRITRSVPAWSWVVLLLLPTLAWALRRVRWRRRATLVATPQPDLHGIEGQIEALIQTLVPLAEALPDSSLPSALRSAGINAADAEQLVRLRERFRALRYGPAGGPIPASLAAEGEDLVRRLTPAVRRASAEWTKGAGAAMLLLASLAAGARLAHAQAQPTPAQLYSRGELHGAAGGFAERTVASPADPANWYNLGAAYYRLGADGRAAAAWQQAHRLAPRDRSVQRALLLVPPPDAASASRLWVPPVTWRELALVAIPLWLVGWVLLAFHRNRRRRDIALLVLVLATVVGAAAIALRWRIREPLAVATTKLGLQLSPHERAPTVAPLEPGTALRVLRAASGWIMVDAPGDRLGWVEAESVILLRDL
ncbi:MAG TPA: BatD family protein [Gemmatimonadales bacterium]|nr:BatD family protein [Gemmatimonadales bacterium]